jgi:hypothetical protein
MKIFRNKQDQMKKDEKGRKRRRPGVWEARNAYKILHRKTARKGSLGRRSV